MVGIFVSGRRTYGKVDEVDGAYVTTTFSHVWWLPIVPRASWLVVGDAGGGRLEDAGIGLSLKSILAGYLRVWSPIWLFFGWVVWSNRSGMEGDEKPWGLVVGSFLGLVVGWFVLGRVGPTQRAQRRVYAEFAGSAVDVALLYGQRDALRDRLHAHIRERLLHAAPSYRGAGASDPDWFAIALSPEVTDASLLRAVLTLARLDGGEAKGARRRELNRAHDALWAKLSAAATA